MALHFTGSHQLARLSATLSPCMLQRCWPRREAHVSGLHQILREAGKHD